jgi:hypothetical protein
VRDVAALLRSLRVGALSPAGAADDVAEAVHVLQEASLAGRIAGTACDRVGLVALPPAPAGAEQRVEE